MKKQTRIPIFMACILLVAGAGLSLQLYQRNGAGENGYEAQLFSYCGNGRCESGEIRTCPQDCGGGDPLDPCAFCTQSTCPPHNYCFASYDYPANTRCTTEEFIYTGGWIRCTELTPVCGDGWVEGGEQCERNDDCWQWGSELMCNDSCMCEPHCGNGVIDYDLGESCEQDSDCTYAAHYCSLQYCQCEGTPCPDGSIQGNEECDDGNYGIGDGCDYCMAEPGWDCNPRNWPQCTPVCGDWMIVGTEQCDDGNLNSGDGCSSSCQTEAARSVCGNYIIEQGEGCDDGNKISGDGCSGNCTTENGWQCRRVCSQASLDVVVADETVVTAKRPTLLAQLFDAVQSFFSSFQKDSTDDVSVEIATVAVVCGDGIRAAGEECDWGIETGQWTCGNNTMYCDLPPPIGNGTCQCLPVPVECGNYILEEGEECELNYSCYGGGTCNYNTCLCEVVCGDGSVGNGEECDDRNTNSNDGCSSECLNEFCGDSVVQLRETCDPGSVCTEHDVWSSISCSDDSDCRSIGATCGYTPQRGKVCYWVTKYSSISCRNSAGCPAGFDGCRIDIRSDCNEVCRWRPSQCGNGVLEDGEDCEDSSHCRANQYCSNCVCYDPGPQPYCGDGSLDIGNEECEYDHQCSAGEICNNQCQCESTGSQQCYSDCSPICGDGLVVGDEECDDGNTRNGDGCSSTCRIERGCNITDECRSNADCLPNETCNLISCTCEVQQPLCGNGIPETGEDCDDGNTSNTDSCTNSCYDADCGDGYKWTGHEECDDSNTSNSDACTNSCDNAECGDGYKWIGHEECDDGNTTSSDGCSALCKNEVNPSCGDGNSDPGEECDDGNTSNTDSCTNSCKDADCGDGYKWIGHEECDDSNTSNSDACTNSCDNAECGDGYKWIGHEECDDGNTVGNDGCSSSCTDEIDPSCGDGIVDSGEECDDGNTSNYDACLRTCKDAECGDGYIRLGSEDCDDDNTIDNDGCSSSCDEEIESFCGDGHVDSDEECEPPGTNTCDAWCNDIMPSDDDDDDEPFPYCGDGNVDSGEECEPPGTNTCDAWCDLIVSSDDDGDDEPFPYCGDGNVDYGEECEPPGTNTCDEWCEIIVSSDDDGDDEPFPYCGDGNVDYGEECEPPDTSMCDTWCQFILTDDDNDDEEEPVSACGNGILDEGEQCEPPGTNTCDNLCKILFEENNVTFVCGNGEVEGSEQCDDGNLIGNDGCSANCISEERSVGALQGCGDGKVDQGEECDDGNLNNFDGCSAKCNNERVGYCGDGILQSEFGEECEPSIYNPLPPYVCDDNCVLISLCGNSRIDAGEQCDNGVGNSDNPGSLCRTDCSLARCGDGIQDPGEMCDDGNLLSGDGCSLSCIKETESMIAGKHAGAEPLYPTTATLQPINAGLPYAAITPLATSRSPSGDTGPGAILVMTGGAVVGWAILRKKRKK